MSFTNIKKTWVLKPRTYQLIGEAAPPLRQIRSRHDHSNHLFYWDEEKKEQRELRYAANSKSPFVDEQAEKGIRVEHLYFREGFLFTNRNDITLQQFLEIHPDNGVIFKELKPEKEAQEEVVDFESRATAYEIVKNLGIDEVAGSMYAEIGEEVFTTSSKELKRDLYIIADADPEYLLKLADDASVLLKYTARRAVKLNILKLADSDRTVKWSKNGRKIIAVPVDQTPYSALAEYFLTDEGVEVKTKVIELIKAFD